MTINDLKQVSVIGGGMMGRQIALNTALHGFEVKLTDSFPNVLDSVRTWSKDYLAGRVAKGRLTQEQADEAAARFHVVDTLEETVKGSQLVIEVIVEDKDKKAELLRNVNALVSKDTIIVTNSSYIVSSTFAGCVDNPSRLANFHYFNPALVMKLVEVVKGPHTSEETVNFLMDFARKSGKTPIRLNKEVDGFVVNSVMRAMRDTAFRLVEDGVCTPEEVDLGVTLGLNHPMGPFHLNDLTGIDSCHYQNERRLKETGVKPAGYDIVKAKFEAHEWGKKTGKGWFDYSDAKK